MSEALFITLAASVHLPDDDNMSSASITPLHSPPSTSPPAPPPPLPGPAPSTVPPSSSTDLRSLLHHYITTHQLDLPRQQQLLSRLRRAGLISSPSSYQHTSGLTRPNKRYLQVTVDQGDAFIDEFIEGETKASPLPLLTLSLQLLHRRYTSHPVVARVTPSFNHTCLFPLQDEEDLLPLASIPSLLSLSSPLYVALTRSDSQGSNLLSTAEVEWREALVHGRVSVRVSLFSEDDSSRPIGLLSLSLSLFPLRLPPPPTLPVFIEAATVQERISADLRLSSLVSQRFHAYTTAWWRELTSLHPLHHNRSLPLFLPTDKGDPAFVCTLLTPTRAATAIDTPSHAARFVRLLGYQREVKLGGVRREVVHSLNALLARRWGDVEDHTFLLCSLLLGFGLDAYVASGVNLSTGGYMVVLTRHDGVVTLWDAVTGHRYLLPSDPPHKPLSSPPPLHHMHCVFNCHQFYANVQLDTDVHLISYDLTSSHHWHSMRAEAIAVLPRRPAFALQGGTVGEGEAARLEGEVRRLVSGYRRQVGDLSTVWSEELSYRLTPALASYEMERVTAVKLFEEEFQSAIHFSTPLHHVFRAVPFQFGGLEVGGMMAGMLENEDFVTMVHEGERGDRGGDGGVGLQFGVKVKVVPYCEEVMAVWVIVASTQPALLIPPRTQ